MISTPDFTPDNRPYQPFGAARELFYCRDKIIMCEGPAGTGKSLSLLSKVLLCAMKWPGSRYLICRKTRSSMTQSILVSFEEKVLPANSPIKSGANREHRSTYRLPNGSEIVIGGLDNPDRIMSTEYDIIAIFEATETTDDDLDKLLTRLRNNVLPFQQVLMDCNPGAPGHWLNARAKAGDITRLKSRHEDNPSLWDARANTWTKFGTDYIGTLDKLTGVRKKRLRYGEWAAAEGLIYENFAEHIVANGARIPETLPSPAHRVCAGLDWGWSDPLAISIGADCHDSKIRIVEELYERKVSPDVLAIRLRALRDKWGIECFYCDPSRPELISLMRRYDVPCVPHRVKLIETGIALVETRLNAGYLDVYDCCLNLIREAGEYEYDKTKDGRTKTVPKPGSDHGVDSLRYLICGMDFGRTLAFSPMAKAAEENPTPAPMEPSDETLVRLGHSLEGIAERERQQAEEAERARVAALLEGERGWG